MVVGRSQMKNPTSITLASHDPPPIPPGSVLCLNCDEDLPLGHSAYCVLCLRNWEDWEEIIVPDIGLGDRPR